MQLFNYEFLDFTEEQIKQWAKEGDEKFIKLRVELNKYKRFKKTLFVSPDNKEFMYRVLMLHNENEKLISFFNEHLGQKFIFGLKDDGSRGLQMTMTAFFKTGENYFYLPNSMLNKYPHL